MSWFWLDQINKEFDESDRYKDTIRKLQKELDNLYDTNADNLRKAHTVFRCLKHVEVMAVICPQCGAERDENGILVHKRKCYLADTLENANDG